MRPDPPLRADSKEKRNGSAGPFRDITQIGKPFSSDFIIPTGNSRRNPQPGRIRSLFVILYKKEGNLPEARSAPLRRNGQTVPLPAVRASFFAGGFLKGVRGGNSREHSEVLGGATAGTYGFGGFPAPPRIPPATVPRIARFP